MKVELTLTAAFLKASYARRMFYDPWKLVIAFLGVLVVVCFGLGDPSISVWVAILITIFVLCLAVFAFAWFQQSKSIDRWILAQGDKPVIYSFSEQGVETESKLGRTNLNWSAFYGIRISDTDTLLHFPGRGGALTLETKQLAPPVIEYLVTQFNRAGKAIVDNRKSAADRLAK